MNSGNPEPADDLSLILNLKRNHSNQTVEVVSQASRWLKAQFAGAGIACNYTPCEPGDPSTFATFSVMKEHKGLQLALYLKVAEIHERPFVFAEIIQTGRLHGSLFPFFADISSPESKQNLLHYISDFVLT